MTPPLLVGREAELARALDLLRGGTPALALVCAEAGQGKTTLLRAVEARARGEGWDAVRVHEGDEVEVTPATTRESFSGLLRAALGLPGHEALAPAGGDFDADPRAARSPQPPLDPLVEQLRRRRGRLLLLVDGYRPSQRFGSWFRDDLLGGLLAPGGTAVVMVADTEQAVRPLASLARATISLEPLGRDLLERHFEALGAHTTPPLTRAEVEAFARESAARPDLLAALQRLLTLPGPRAAGPDA